MDEYLYDPKAPAAEEVVEIERRLAPLRYQPRNVIALRQRRRWPLLAAAAMLAVVALGVGAWIWTWPPGRSWKVERGPIARLPVGETVKAGESMLVRVARIGWMRVAERSTVKLESTRSNRHRLSMSSGTVRLSVWAPPRSVTILTPAGDVVDLGCEFIVRADEKVTSVDVVSGWVQLRGRALGRCRHVGAHGAAA
jgi:ferric-dicitrate binding protein FerR (iron transport regulator)